MNDETEQLEEVEEDQGIPRFETTLGGRKYWVTFSDPDMLTGKHLAALRTAYGSSENPGTATNNLLGLAIELLVEAWELGGIEQKLPKYDKSGKAEWRGCIPAKVLVRLEQHLMPHLEFITKPRTEDEGEPGGPRQPGRD